MCLQCVLLHWASCRSQSIRQWPVTPKFSLLFDLFLVWIAWIQSSVNFIKEIDELLKIYFVVWLYASYLNHRWIQNCQIHKTTYYEAPHQRLSRQAARTLPWGLLNWYSLSYRNQLSEGKYLLFSVEHWESKNKVIFSWARIATGFFYNVYELFKL